MPVVYAPPDALDADILSRSGRQDALFQQAQITARREAAALAAQADFQRNAVAAGEQRARAGAAAADLQQRQYEFGEQLRQRERLASLESESRLAEIDRRGQVAAFLQTMEPGYAEQKQYENDLASISRLMADTTLSPRELEERISEMMPGVKMTRQRLEMAQAKQREALAEQELAQSRRFAQMEKEAEEFNALAPEKRVVPLPDGSKLVRTGPRDWKLEPPPKPEQQTDNFGRTAEQIRSATAEVQRRVDAWIKEDREFRIKNQLPEQPWDREALVQRELEEQERELRRRLGGQQTSPGGAGVPTPDGIGDTPPERALEKAQERVETLKKNLSYIESLNSQLDRLPERVAAEFKPQLGLARGLLEQFGSPDAMPPDVRRDYTTAVEAVVRSLMESRPADRPRQSGAPRREGFTTLKFQ